MCFVRLAALLVPALTPAASAETVLVLWGDSLVCGFGADALTSTPFGPAPFGAAVPNALRWDAEVETWAPVTHEQNYQGLGADLAYGAAAAWRVAHPNDGPVYVVSLGVPGSDVTAAMQRPDSSWSPAVEGSALELFMGEHLMPALASLKTPRVAWICGSAGNNHVPEWNAFESDLAATWNTILEHCPGRPKTLMTRSYLRGNIAARSAITASGYGVVDLDPLPLRTDGLQPDGVHLTHFGNVYAGVRIALIADALPPPPRTRIEARTPEEVAGQGAPDPAARRLALNRAAARASATRRGGSR